MSTDRPTNRQTNQPTNELTKKFIDEFMNLGKKDSEETEISKRMRTLSGGKLLSAEQMLNYMKDELGEESRKKMEDMLKQGYSMQDVVNHMMQHGKSQKEEENEFVDKMSKLIEGKDLSESEILDLLRKELGEERGAMINAMLRDGKSMKDVIDHFMKNVNELLSSKKKTHQIRTCLLCGLYLHRKYL